MLVERRVRERRRFTVARDIDRRGFVRRIAGLGVAACSVRSVTGLVVHAAPVATVTRDIGVAKGGTPFDNTVAAVEALGGMAAFWGNRHFAGLRLVSVRK